MTNKINNTKQLEKKLKNAYIKNHINLIVDYFAIHYKYFKSEDLNYNQILNSSNDNYILTKKEINEIIIKSQEILKNSHNIFITSEEEGVEL